MNIQKTIALSLLIVAKAGIAVAQTDSTTTVANDSVTWSKELDGVVMKAQRQLVKMEADRIGYDVQADEDSKTLSVAEMLRKVPLVMVDGEDNISVKGKSDFKIYKNGHYDPSLSKNAKEILKNMPASMVKRIEVITAPGAREDAEGVDAVLNIVMKSTTLMEGMMGSVSATYSSIQNHKVSGSMTGQMGRLLLSADYAFYRMSALATDMDTEKDYTYLATGNKMHTSTQQKRPGYQHFITLEASYDIDTLNLLSATFDSWHYTIDQYGDVLTTMTSPAGDTTQSYLATFETPMYYEQDWNGRVDYEHKTRRKGERLTLSYMLALTRRHGGISHNYMEKRNAPFDYTGRLCMNRDRFLEHTFQVDWLRPLGRGQQIEVGAKYINRNSNSHQVQDFEGTDSHLSDEFRHITEVMAAYADYQYKEERWSARAGVRYEYSYMKGSYPDGKSEAFDKRLNDWVPQASLKYQFTEAHSLKLGYTTSISRPSIHYLNPSAYTLPSVVSSGNAHLSSAHSQSINLTYSYVGRKLTLLLNPTYSFCSSGIAQVQTAKGDVRYNTYGNILQKRLFLFEQYAQWRPFEGTTVIVSNDLYYTYFGHPDAGYSNHGWWDYLYVNLSQRLPWNLRLTLNGYTLIGHRPNGIYYDQDTYSGCSASLQRSFLKDNRLTLRLNLRNPFGKYISHTNRSVNGDYHEVGIVTQRNRSLSLTLTYRFGSLKTSVKKTEHTIENDDMMGGISK